MDYLINNIDNSVKLHFISNLDGRPILKYRIVWRFVAFYL